ncbi:MAG: Uma2 family endonuclease [Chloroflexi bacterium]|nr:Uma2 family endonuclease [Chloroflexota bacterium]
MATQAPPATLITEAQPGTRPKMTYDEFLAWAGEDMHAEWVKGEVFVYMTAHTIHQRLVGFLIRLIQDFADLSNLGEVFAGPMQVKLSPEGSGREPDVFFVAQERLEHVTEKYFDGAPDLAVEVISEDSVNRDRVDKFEEYEEAGVREYWIIDPRPRRRRADFYQLGADGKYQPVPLNAEGVYHSAVLPGFWLKASWLWEDPLPKLAPTLKEIEGK